MRDQGDGILEGQLIDVETPKLTANLPLPPSPAPHSSTHPYVFTPKGPKAGEPGSRHSYPAYKALLADNGLTKPQLLHVQEELDSLSDMFPDMSRDKIKEFMKDYLKRDLQEESKGSFT